MADWCSVAPDRAVTGIEWRPERAEGGWEVAVTSEDSGVRIYEVRV